MALSAVITLQATENPYQPQIDELIAKMTLDEGVASLMTAFNTINGVPASGSVALVNDLLRGEWYPDGYGALYGSPVGHHRCGG